MQKTQLALFPLQLFLLPGETTKLHIFEERYRQLLTDCEEIDITFGIPFTENGTIAGYGSIVQLKQVLIRHKNGSADIEIESIGVFEVNRFFLRMGEKLYPGGDVTILDHIESSLVSKELFSKFKAYMLDSNRSLGPESFSANLNLIDLARLLNLDDDRKIEFLKIATTKQKERFLADEIGIRNLLLKQSRSIEQNIFLN
ncbi:MAG: LON peptidase substrate-binding domain-containing protein [Flavobacteriales bacterium]|nr:LON peptidase substrate-binding domain-containing protein [Flavobacteriales bacterium]